jgi:hypothetical protein
LLLVVIRRAFVMRPPRSLNEVKQSMSGLVHDGDGDSLRMRVPWIATGLTALAMTVGKILATPNAITASATDNSPR